MIGVGGGGSNAVQRMIEFDLEGVQFVMANTDLQALERFQSPKAYMLPLGEKITGGLGAGGNPEVGREAAEEDVEKIQNLLVDAHMVFVTAGMGGGTGTGAAPVIARAAKDMGKLCVAVVTTPFHFEGQRKYQLALEGLEALRKEVDTLIEIPNQLLLQVLEQGTSVREAFMTADEVLRMGVKGIADLITQPGDINVDFNDVCTVMCDGGKALMGIGVCSGDERARLATQQALENPLLNGSQMHGATGLLVQVTADESFSLDEYSIIMDEINGYVDTEAATVISGIAIDGQKKDEIKVTVIATGFPYEPQNFGQDPSLQQGVSSHRVKLRGGQNRGQLRQIYGGAKTSGVQSRVQPHKRQGGAAQNPLNSPLSTPLSTPMKAVGSQASAASSLGPAVTAGSRSASPSRFVASRVSQGNAPQPAGAEAGQAAQMRQSLQQNQMALSDEGPEAPDRVYRMTEQDNRLMEEQWDQVSNTELQLLFSEGAQGRDTSAQYAGGEPGVHSHDGHIWGQRRVEPQLPKGPPNEDLYVPTLLRRKQRKPR